MTLETSSKLRKLTACALIAAACGVASFTLPTRAEALRCRTTARVRLAAVDPTAVPRMRGTARVVGCSDGSSLLEVMVRAKGIDGAAFIPTLPSIEPLLGEWFYMANNKGEGFIQNVYAEQVHGRTVVVADGGFNEVMSAVFP